jgi:rhodanese-related sulfurtransferase
MYHHLLILLLSFLIACKPNDKSVGQGEASIGSIANSTQKQDKPDITVQEAKERLAASKDIVLIDVRTPNEVAAGVIGQPLVIDIANPNFAQEVAKLDKNKEYIVYCAVGGRSSSAVSYMRQEGFTKVYNMLGGYNEWVKY